jgi:hypothetical protein
MEAGESIMRPRHLLGVAVFWGVVGTLGGTTAQAAAPPSSPKAVKLFLQMLEKGIKSDNKAQNTRNKDLVKFNAAKPGSKTEKQLAKTLTKLSNQIFSMTTTLIGRSAQGYNAASSLSPPDPPLKSRAFADILAVQQLSLGAHLGIQPATPTS